MALSSAQIVVIRADFQHRITPADPLFNQALADAAFSANDAAIAAFYNGLWFPDFFCWQTAVPVEDVLDKVAWANLTPADAPDGTQLWGNRALQCQGKQFNLQNLILGRTTVNASKDNVRAGFQDALSNVPSGAGGAPLSGGWPGVRDAMSRKARVAERLLADVTSGSGSTPQLAAKFTFQGTIDQGDAGNFR